MQVTNSETRLPMQTQIVAVWFYPCSSAYNALSRQSEKFLFGQSRKFLLTAVRLRDGTNRDESGGTRLVGLVEACTGWKDHAEASRRTDGREPAVGPEAAAAHETRRRSGGG